MRLFLAAAAGLEAEHRAVVKAAERIGSRLGGNGSMEVVDWSHQVKSRGVPTAGRDDFFVGLAWLSFRTDSDPAPASESDFELARDLWKKVSAESGTHRSLFYRCRRLPAALSEIDGSELTRVDQFFSRFKSGSPGRYHDFHTVIEFETRIEGDLFQLIKGAHIPVSPKSDEVEGRPGFATKMQVGKAYEVTFLTLELVNFRDIVERYQSQKDKVDVLMRSFRRLVVSTAATYGGESFVWEGHLGLMIFWSRRSFDHAIITGLKVIHELPVFNVDPAQNPLGTTIAVRAAAHDAVIVFQEKIDQISSPDIDFVHALRRTDTLPGELTVSKRLLDRADDRLKPRFRNKGRFQSEPIFACHLPSTQQHTLRSTLDETHQKVGAQIGLIRQILSLPPDDLETTAVESLSAAVDEAYALLNKACGALGTLDRSWSKKYFAELVKVVAWLVKKEEDLWKVLRGSLGSYREAPHVFPRLEAIVKAASTRRSKPAVTLAKAEHSLRSLTQLEAKPPEPEPLLPSAKVDDSLLKKIRALERADPLDQETALTDLLLSNKADMVELLSKHPDHPQHRPLIDKLWESADLILIDDLYSIRGHKRASDQKIFDVLVGDPIADGRFQVTQRLLGEKFKPSEAMVRQRLEKAGVEVENRDLQTIWRCIVLGHPVVEIRTLAAFKMSQFSMWQAISHPSMPIASIHAIGERVAKAESDDAKKIFFDCTRAQIAAAVESFRTREELESITKLILLLLDFSFLVETGYFERFDDILGGFLGHAQKVGLKVDYFENLRRRLDLARLDPDQKTSSKPPAGISKLPLTLQRRLAAEPHYTFWFVTHPDPRIAGETLRHINLGNIERVLRLPEINGVVMASLLRKPELFTRSQPLLAALNNPKCEQSFAGRHLPSLARSRTGVQAVEKLSRNPSANPGVRAAARQLLANQKRRAAR